MLEYDVAAPAPGSDTVQLDERNTKPDRIEGREGIIRHVEFSTFMDLETAQRVRDWLTKNIEQLTERNR
jgi:hypothetical protein